MTKPTPHGAPELLPCPFCGAVGVTVSETSTFRWVAAACESCGAVGPEARRDTMKQWPNEAEDTAKAIKEWNTRAAIRRETRIIEPPDFDPRPGVTDGMSPDDLWQYACLVGYRYKLSEHDREQSARAAIQQADQERVATMQEAMRQGTAHFYATCKTGLNGEDGALMRALELVYKYGRGSSAVEPRESGSVVGSIPTSGHPIQCGGVPLTEDQIKACLPDAVRLPIGWLNFARAIEAAHGIGKAPRPSAPTGQIKKAPVDQTGYHDPERIAAWNAANPDSAATDAELTRIYNEANGFTSGKAQPITTKAIFKAMRACLVAQGKEAGV